MHKKPVPLDCKCGLGSCGQANLADRISNGGLAQIADHHWTALVGNVNEVAPNVCRVCWWCTASLIDNCWALTAAHCLAVNETNIGIFVGSNDRNEMMTNHWKHYIQVTPSAHPKNGVASRYFAYIIKNCSIIFK